MKNLIIYNRFFNNKELNQENKKNKKKIKFTKNEENYYYLFKIILIGDSGVGKSSIMKRYTDNTYNDTFLSTIGVDFIIKNIRFDDDDKIAKLQIWDTAGQERFKTFTSSYYRGIHGAIICYDVTERNSFNNIKKWINELNFNTSINKSQIVLVGNKNDIDDKRRVFKNEGLELANRYQIKFIEVSAKDNYKIEDIFTKLAFSIRDNFDKLKYENDSKNIIKLKNESFINTDICC